MGGTLTVDSELGRGSCFSFQIDCPAAPAEVEIESPKVCTGWPSGMRVLVVDDNAINLRVAKKMLERLGASVEVRSSGHAALEALSSEPFDVMLIDCQMPEMDGYEATRQWRRREGTGRRTPVVALTATIGDGERERCLEAGMDDYLSKPVRLEDLRALGASFGGPRVAA